MRVSIAVAGVIVPTHAALAGDGIRPRTPVSWPDDVECLTVVDRSRTTVLNVPYAIPFEDPPRGETLTDDELPDGRRHQFFAFAEDIDPRLALPEWITWDDVMRAADAGLTDPEIPDAWVLETHPLFSTAFARINADDARRPITFAAAAQGVDWDLSSVEPGTYVIRAYTFDPWPNLWADPRPGAIAIVDDPDPSAQAPSLSVVAESYVVHRDQTARLLGCVRAMDGTSLNADWASFDDLESAWSPLAVDVPLDGESFEIAFEPPEALWGEFAVVRVVATDPMGRTYTAFVPERITVLDTDAPGTDDTGGEASTGAGETGDSGQEGSTTQTGSVDGDTTGSQSGSSTSGSPTDGMPADGGCGCASSHSRGLGWIVPIWMVFRSRRARRGTMRKG